MIGREDNGMHILTNYKGCQMKVWKFFGAKNVRSEKLWPTKEIFCWCHCWRSFLMKLEERMPRTRKRREDSSEESSLASYRRKRHRYMSDHERVSSRSTYTGSRRGKYEDSESSTRSRRRNKRTRSRSEHRRRRWHSPGESKHSVSD